MPALLRHGHRARQILCHFGATPVEARTQLDWLPLFPNITTLITLRCIDEPLINILRGLPQLRYLAARLPDAPAAVETSMHRAVTRPSYPSSSHSKGSSSKAFLPNLTHLELLGSVISDWEQISFLPELPSLTHLYLKPSASTDSQSHYNPQHEANAISAVLSNCELLEVLLLEVDHLRLFQSNEPVRRLKPVVANTNAEENVALHSRVVTHERFGWKDERVVGMVRGRTSLLGSWERMLYGGESYWTVAAEIIQKGRKVVESQARSPIILIS